MAVKINAFDQRQHAPPPFCTVMATPDTGANKSIISSRVLDTLFIRYGATKLSRSHTIQTANGGTLDCSGSVNLLLFYEGSTTAVNALVSNDLYEDFLLSWKDLQRIGVLSDHFPHLHDSPKGTKALSAVTTNDTLESLLAEFQDVFQEEKVTPMHGEPMHIHIRKNDPEYRPLRMKVARRTPKHFQKDADELIKKLLDSGVIAKVPANEHVEWCSPGFFVPKPNGKCRLVTDYRQINKFIDRPVHPFPSCRDIIRGIKPDSRWFLKFDMAWGYFQMPLDDESSRLTTFLVESGRYRFLRAPMGLNPSSDYFCERSDYAFADVLDLLKIVDDGLLQAPTRQDLLRQFRLALECCRKSNLTLSQPKLEIGQSVVFAGYDITKDGVKPAPKRTEGISNFPVPKNVSELRSFLGLVNQLGIFIPDLAHVTNDLRALLKKNVAYTWLPDHQKAFEDTKRLLLSDLLLRPFDVGLKSELLTDASRLFGLGYALVQRNPEGTTLSLIQCGSRSLNSAESRYSTTELECLAIYYAVKECSFYLQGIEFEVLTDHKPLVGAFLKPLSELENARLLRFREKLAHYALKVSYVSGKTHLIADALSRAPVFSPPENEMISVNSIASRKKALDPALQSYFDAASDDEAYRSIVLALLGGKSPSVLPPGHPARQYRSLWDDLSVMNDTLLVLDDSRIVVPKACRPATLAHLHAAHAGITRTRQLAKDLYYWPGMNAEIANMVQDCDSCQRLRPSLHENAQAHPKATAPMHCVGLDLFQLSGKDYLVMVDRFSYYIWVHHLRSTTTTAVVNVLEQWFLEYGYPYVIISDNGPQFRSEFKTYCREHHVVHTTSSPYNPRSNGLAESAVKSAKYLLQKSSSFKDFQERLQVWRNTPSASNPNSVSPSEMFFTRRQRTRLLPALSEMPDPLLPATDDSLLPRLRVGDPVRIQHPKHGTWDEKGEVIAIQDSGLAYTVRDEQGDLSIRGRRLLRLDKATSPGQALAAVEPDTPPNVPASPPVPEVAHGKTNSASDKLDHVVNGPAAGVIFRRRQRRRARKKQG